MGHWAIFKKIINVKDMPHRTNLHHSMLKGMEMACLLGLQSHMCTSSSHVMRVGLWVNVFSF